jgi:hypothetical protein
MPKIETAPVGADVESLCGKCGDVWHVVVAKVGDRIAQVLCKQCGNTHRHRPPGGPVATSTPSDGARAKPRTARAKAAPAPAAPPPYDPERPPRPYRPTERFAPGDRIDHPTFGRGIVATLPEPGKIEVVFGAGERRLLAQAKADSTLARPTTRPAAAAPGDDEGRP